MNRRTRRVLDIGSFVLGTGVYALVWGIEVSYAGLAGLLVFMVVVSAVLDVTMFLPKGPEEE